MGVDTLGVDASESRLSLRIFVTFTSNGPPPAVGVETVVMLPAEISGPKEMKVGQFSFPRLFVRPFSRSGFLAGVEGGVIKGSWKSVSSRFRGCCFNAAGVEPSGESSLAPPMSSGGVSGALTPERTDLAIMGVCGRAATGV